MSTITVLGRASVDDGEGGIFTSTVNTGLDAFADADGRVFYRTAGFAITEAALLGALNAFLKNLPARKDLVAVGDLYLNGGFVAVK